MITYDENQRELVDFAHSLEGQLPEGWRVGQRFNIEYFRFELAVGLVSQDDYLYMIMLHYDTGEKLKDWEETDTERILYLATQFPASKCLFLAITSQYDGGEPFFSRYEFLIDHTRKVRV